MNTNLAPAPSPRRVARAACHAALAVALFMCAAAHAQLQPLTWRDHAPKGLPDGEYYRPFVPFLTSSSLPGLRLYRKEADGSLHPWACTFASQIARDQRSLDTCSWGPFDGVGPVPFDDADRAFQRFQANRAVPTDGPAQYWRGLRDLVPDGKARGHWQPLAKLVDGKWVPDKDVLAGKRILLVLSSDSTAAFERLDELRRRVGAWAAGQPAPQLKDAAAELASLEPAKLLAANVVDSLKRRKASVTYGDDLSTFRSGDCDFALVVDFELIADPAGFVTDLDRQMKYRGKLPREDVSPVSASLNYVLLDPALRVVVDAAWIPRRLPDMTWRDEEARGQDRAMTVADEIKKLSYAVEIRLTRDLLGNDLLASSPAGDQ